MIEMSKMRKNVFFTGGGGYTEEEEKEILLPGDYQENDPDTDPTTNADDGMEPLLPLDDF